MGLPLGPRVFFSGDGWEIETPVALSAHQVAASVKWARANFLRTLSRLPRGERASALTAALRTLNAATIRQRLVNPYTRTSLGDRYLVAPDLIGGR